jgi:hypothetical protein
MRAVVAVTHNTKPAAENAQGHHGRQGMSPLTFPLPLSHSLRSTSSALQCVYNAGGAKHSPPTPIWATEVGCPAPPLFGRLQGCFEFCFGF